MRKRSAAVNMNGKLDRLLTAARNDPPPEPDSGFEGRVMAAIRRSPAREGFSFLDQLNLLFPRVAFASAAIIGCCILTEVCLGTFSSSDLSSQVAEISEQWLFAAK